MATLSEYVTKGKLYDNRLFFSDSGMIQEKEDSLDLKKVTSEVYPKTKDADLARKHITQDTIKV